MKYFVTSKLSENISKTPEGFLLCLNVPIARTGEMIYGQGESPIEVGPDGKAIVSRDAREVFRPETVASFEGKAITIAHPEDFVNPGNWKVLAKGHMQNIRRGTGEHENDLLADILVTDKDAIALVEGGLREVSCGYEAEYIELGVGRGMQTNIIGNHLALVEAGRAGSTYAINDQQGAKMKTIGEKIKAIFAKAGDEAAKVADTAGADSGTAATNTDEVPGWAKSFMKEVRDAMASMSSSASDEEEAAKKKKEQEDAAAAEEKKKKEGESADADPEPEPAKADDAMEARFSKLEDAVAKLCDAMGIGEEEEAAEGESADEEGEGEEEESEDDDFEESPAAQASDEKSRIEILAPGLKAAGKDAKRKALVKAYESKDNKVIIDRLNGGKALDLNKAPQKTIDHLFIGASEVVALYRTKNFAKTRASLTTDNGGSKSGPMTADKLNEINAKHYAQAQKGAH